MQFNVNFVLLLNTTSCFLLLLNANLATLFSTHFMVLLITTFCGTV